MILRSTSLTSRVKCEMKHHHKWFGIIFYYSESFPRALRLLSLTTNVTIMLFVQSITYAFTNPDDGTCVTFDTKAACLADPSPYATGASKCYWDYNTKECALVEPDSDVRVILFVAIFSALLSTPFAVGIDYIIMFVLAPPSKQDNPASCASSPLAAINRASGRQSRSLSPQSKPSPLSLPAQRSQSGDEEESLSSRSMEEGVQRAELTPSAPGTPLSTGATSRLSQSSATRGRRTGRVSGSSSLLLLSLWRGSLTAIETEEQRKQNEAGAIAQTDLRALIFGITEYRILLTAEERVEFDGKRFIIIVVVLCLF